MVRTYCLRSGGIDGRELSFGTIKSPIGILVVPAKISPSFIRVVLLDSIDFLQCFVPLAGLWFWRLPFIESTVHVTAKFGRVWVFVFFLGDTLATSFLLLWCWRLGLLKISLRSFLRKTGASFAAFFAFCFGALRSAAD